VASDWFPETSGYLSSQNTVVDMLGIWRSAWGTNEVDAFYNSGTGVTR